MLYESLASLPPSQFRRACGFSRSTFQAMLEVLRPELDRSGKRGGQNSLSVENQLLLTLQYWREYRTSNEKVSNSGGFEVSSLAVEKIFRLMFEVLILSSKFYLP